MSQIFKVNHINKNNIIRIYVFTGSHKIQTTNYGPQGEKIFSAQEWAHITEKNIPVKLVPHYIHGDDTISNIKKKNNQISPI